MNTIKQVIALYKSTLNPKSKWYNDDLNSFIAIAETKTEAQLLQQLANLRAITGNDDRFNKVVEKEEKRMLKAGMFDIGNMQHKNALD